MDGCPIPEPADTPAWERGLVEPIRSVQRVVEWPVAWIRTRLRVTQQWAVYQAPGTERYRMSIEGQTRDAVWHVLYRAGDDDHAEDADRIEYARARSAWDPMKAPPEQYPQFARWATAQALARHPELVAARVRMEKIVIGDGRYDGTGDYAFVFARSR
ncbi:MAG TPA: hypothetical protein VLX92_12255 [Kofleriaceae bacterium]|nr:hypothetical protein [Kofleriaceae bacterium]